MKKKIVFFSGSRAEYHIQEPILRKIQKNQFFKTYFIISGSHISKSFGESFNIIKNNKINIYKKINLKITSNLKNGQIDYIFNLQKKISKILLKIKPDFIFLTSDRFETLSVAIVAHILKIPIIHLEGGDVTEGGTLDDNSRHAITKLASLHLVTNIDSKKRVLRLGEEQSRVLNVGFPPLSNIDKKKLLKKNQIEKKLNFKLDNNLNIFTYHPVPGELKKENIIFKAISVLSKKNYKFIITYPNFDYGYKNIIKEIKKIEKNKNIFVVKNLGQELYFSILNFIGNNNGICIGNSSSGIKETMFFNCKTINIGIRQKSRFMTKNIYQCSVNTKKIIELYEKIKHKKINYTKLSNPYFAPNKINDIDKKIIKKIANLKSEIKKITY